MRQRQSAVSGIIGASIAYTLSPALHEQEAEALGFALSYQIIDTSRWGSGGPSVAELIDHARTLGFAGLNVTFPHKREAFDAVDDVVGIARDLEAVNTVVFRDGESTGYNTDASGFGTGIDALLTDIHGAVVVQFGAGGAGAATAQALAVRSVRSLTIIDLEPKRAFDEAERLKVAYPGVDISVGDPFHLDVLLARADGVVNATPVGSVNIPGSVVPPHLLRPDLWVADIVYAPLETELLRDARRRGARTLHGGHMLVNQAADSFELFHDVKPDRDRMWTHFVELVGGGAG